MQSFPVDDDLVELVWHRANPRPFEQLTFSAALRRVLTETGSDSIAPIGRSAKPKLPSADDLLAELGQMSDEELKNLPSYRVQRRQREPKTDLLELIQLGYLHEGQELFPIDYQGKRLKFHKAILRGAQLEFGGERYSLSTLAERLLQEEGFQSTSVRGPLHWVTADGQRVSELWAKVLSKRIVGKLA